MANLKIKIVESSGRRIGGDLSIRELNIILEQLLAKGLDSISFGKYIVKKSDIISMDVFENNNHTVSGNSDAEKQLPDEFVELFLTIADMCDGEFWENKINRKAVEDAYLKVLNLKLCSKVYEDACRKS